MFASLFSQHALQFDTPGFRIDQTNLRVRVEQLRTRIAMYPSLVLSQMLLQPMFVWLYWGSAPHYWLLLWLSVFYALHALELVKWYQDKEHLDTLQECADWHVHFTVFALAVGLLWAVGAVVFFPMSISEQSILICVMLGLVAGAVTINPVHPPSLYGFVFGIMIPLIVQVFLVNDAHHWILGVMLSLFTVIVVRDGRKLNRTFVLSLKQRFENADLLQQVSAKKSEAEEARNQLTKANAALKETMAELTSLNASLAQRVKEQTEKNIEKERLLIHQSRNAAMGEMISNIAHQWRQPLSTLGLIVQNILLDYRDNQLGQKELEAYSAEAQQCVTHMSKTIDDFRNFFRPDKAKTNFSLSQVVGESLKLLDATLKNNNIHVTLGSDPGLHTSGHMNEFAQVILNVLANAKDALVSGKPGSRQIEIEFGREGSTGMIMVRDNAGGIAEDILPSIFDPYFTTKETGTGIGLYMSKTIIERHMGGSITCRNTAEGAEFTISIPLAVQSGQGTG